MEDFGELLTTSGLLVDKRITWLTFHSCFDFGYLIKTIILGELPTDEKEFFRFHRSFFPTSFDIKMLIKQPAPVAAMLKGSLQDVIFIYFYRKYFLIENLRKHKIQVLNLGS